VEFVILEAERANALCSFNMSGENIGDLISWFKANLIVTLKYPLLL